MQQITSYAFSKHTGRPTILKIYQPSTKTWIVKLQNADTDATELYKTDLNNTPEGQYTHGDSEGNEVFDTGVYIADSQSDFVAVSIRGYMDITRTERHTDSYEGTVTYPRYIYTVEGETETEETDTATAVSWFPISVDDLTYAEKQTAVINAYREIWESQKRAWLGEAPEYSDGVPDIVEQVGYYMRAAVAFIKNRFQDPDITPTTTENVIKEMAKGAADITTVDKFAENIRTYKALLPTGPTQAYGWVSIDAEGNVTRTNLADAVQLGEGTLPDDFNSFDDSWLVINQEGSVSLDSTTPVSGTALVATLSDPDGGITSDTTWSWETKATDGDWTEVTRTITSTSTTSSYTPVNDDVGKILRVTATYTDNAADDNTVTSEETSAVTADI